MPRQSMRHQPFSSSTVCYLRSTAPAYLPVIARAAKPPVAIRPACRRCQFRHQPCLSSTVCYPARPHLPTSPVIARAAKPPVAIRPPCHCHASDRCHWRGNPFLLLKNVCIGNVLGDADCHIVKVQDTMFHFLQAGNSTRILTFPLPTKAIRLCGGPI